jgi:hypothetical protein
MFDFILTNKPVLVGLHLGFAILGIDGLLWLAGEIIANPANRLRMKVAAGIGMAGLGLSWLAGGYYYVKYYGSLVKPEILKGSAPWAHAVAMEAKEHIFLFLIPMTCVVLAMMVLSRDQQQQLKVKRPLLFLVLTVTAIGLSLGLMGYIISAAARWGLA